MLYCGGFWDQLDGAQFGGIYIVSLALFNGDFSFSIVLFYCFIHVYMYLVRTC